jgi:hypothetical protein
MLSRSCGQHKTDALTAVEDSRARQYAAVRMTSGGVEQRGAVRLPLTEPLPVTLGDAAATMIEISLIGCRVEHEARMQLGMMTTLDLPWRGYTTRLTVLIARSEFGMQEGRGHYTSGLQFCPTMFDSPEPVPSIIASAVQKVGALTPRPAHVGSGDPYIECSFDGTSWTKTRARTPRQPREGFTLPMPESQSDLDRFCRAYARAADDVRRELRAAAEIAIVREGRHSAGSSA